MKRIPSFCITLLVVEGVILIYPTAYGPAYLVPSNSIRELRYKLENYIERVKEVLL